MHEVRIALLEADVALPVVTAFIDQVKDRALGKEVQTELVKVMGEANEGPNLKANPPAIILMAGLQGAGKTTTVAKLGRWLQNTQKKKVGVVSADIYSPAAINLEKSVERGFIVQDIGFTVL